MDGCLPRRLETRRLETRRLETRRLETRRLYFSHQCAPLAMDTMECVCMAAGDSSLELGSDSSQFTLLTYPPVTPRRDDRMPE